MEPERWRAVRAVFDELVDLAPSARAERLAAVGSIDPELRQAVEALLAADPEAEESLSEKLFGLPARADPLGLAGRTVSHFRVLELLGSGGMGAVYSAEDTRLNRPVALWVAAPTSAWP